MIEIKLILSFFVFITGACIGSFLNVAALRSLSDESIILPPSKCPVCNDRIKWYDNIPVLSYLFTFKGKCRSCGCKVSIQYPIVETITALIFLFVYLFFGISIKSVLLLILFCIAIVISITDIKENAVYNRHSIALIAAAIIYSFYTKGLENYSFPILGLITGVIVMEILAKLSYYFINKKQNDEKEKTEETNCEKENSYEEDDENTDINTYIEKNKRAFGEGDTYIAAASGAILGWKYFLLTLFCSIVLQALCILPQFIKNLYTEKEYKLLFSLAVFFIFALIYFGISNIITINLFTAIAFIVLLLFFAINSIIKLKKFSGQKGFAAIPFGPALLAASFIILFFGQHIASFLNKHIFMMIW